MGTESHAYGKIITIQMNNQMNNVFIIIIVLFSC